MLVSSWSEKILGNRHHRTWERGVGLSSLRDMQSNDPAGNCQGWKLKPFLNPFAHLSYDCSLYALREWLIHSSNTAMLCCFSMSVLVILFTWNTESQLSNPPPSVRAQLHAPSPGGHSGEQRLRLCLVLSLPQALSIVSLSLTSSSHLFRVLFTIHGKIPKNSLEHWFSTRGNLPSRGIWEPQTFWLSQREGATDIQWVEVREVTKHPVMLKAAPTTKNYLGQNHQG